MMKLLQASGDVSWQGTETDESGYAGGNPKEDPEIQAFAASSIGVSYTDVQCVTQGTALFWPEQTTDTGR